MDEKTAEFIEKMTDVYRHCDTYQDSGLIQTTITLQDRVIKSHNSFSTFYVRPGRLSMNIWFSEDQSGSAIGIVYTNGEVYVYREDSGVEAIHCESISDALWKVTTFCNWNRDGFELAVPALLDSDVRMSCGANFFSGDCRFVQQLNLKTHLRKSDGMRATDIWIRPDLTVHDVEVQSETKKEVLIGLHQQAMELMPDMKELVEKAEQMTPGLRDSFAEYASDISTKSRRVFSHVLFDQDVDGSVFEFPGE